MASPEKANRPPVVLVASDEEWAARSLESILAPNGYAVVRASSGRQALEFVRATAVDAVIVEGRTLEIDAIEMCRLLRQEPRIGVWTPIILTASDTGGRARRLEAYGAGAWQFCSQPIDGEALLHLLRTFVESKRATDALREESLLDDLTGLYSLRGLARRAREIGAEALRRRAALACIAFAPAGDARDDVDAGAISPQLARHIGAVCRRTGRVSDAFGRVSPTEFAIVAPATDAAGAVRVVERLRAAIEEESVFADWGPQRRTMLAGYCAVPDFAESPVDTEEMMMRATVALRDVRGLNSKEIRAFEPARSIQR